VEGGQFRGMVGCERLAHSDQLFVVMTYVI